ncbi:hypothetical protein [Sphingomonas sp. ERG5]|uniref:hypothetical protein n=1 Tax=Sphingomonas sp. ERG5 TaxID=1381597 RepID=UPI00054B1508|nr:hypothetical protein [Sphingomonas sp. ERG5]
MAALFTTALRRRRVFEPGKESARALAARYCVSLKTVDKERWSFDIAQQRALQLLQLKES